MARSAAAARPRGPARTTIQWQKVGRLALLFTLFVIVLLYIRPVSHWVQQRSTAAHSQADLRDLQREHDRLEARLRQLSGTGAIEREARNMGMVRRGERPYSFDAGGH
ncbi:MAG TPA: septum formation initiator family protein [Thermoleophilaceae bacterium]